MPIKKDDPRLQIGTRVIASRTSDTYAYFKGDTGTVVSSPTKVSAGYIAKIKWDEGTEGAAFCREMGYEQYGCYLHNLDFLSTNPADALFT